MSQTAGGAGLTRQASKSKIPLPKHTKAGDDSSLSAIANGVPSKLKKRGASMPPALGPDDHHDESSNGVNAATDGHKDEQVVGVAAPIIEAAVEADDMPQLSPAVQLFPQTPAKPQTTHSYIPETPAPSLVPGATTLTTPLPSNGSASFSTPLPQSLAAAEFATPGPRSIPATEFQNLIAAMSPQPPQAAESPQQPNSPSANSSSIEPSVSALSTPSDQQPATAPSHHNAQSDAVSEEEEEVDFGDDDVVVHNDVPASVPEYVAFMKKPVEDKEVKQTLAAHAEGPENYDEFPDTELQLVTPSKGDSLSSQITPSPLGTRTVTSSEFRQLSSRMQRTPSNTDSASPMSFTLPSTTPIEFVELVDPIYIFNAFPSKPLVLDVRSSEEYEAGHVPGAWNAPVAPTESDITLESLMATMSQTDQKAFKPLITNISRKNNLSTGSNRIDLPTLFVYDDMPAGNENSLAFRVAKSLSSASCRAAVIKGGINSFLAQYPDMKCQEQAKLRRNHKINFMFWQYPTEIIPQRLYLGPWLPACPLNNTVTDVITIESSSAKPKSNPFGVDLEKLRPDVRVHPVQIDEPKSEDDAASMLGAIKVLNKALSNPVAKVVVVDQLGGNNLAAACVTVFLMDNQRIPLTQALGFVTRHRSTALSSDFTRHPESPPAYVLLGEVEYRLFSTGTLADVADTAPLMKAYPQKRRLWELIDPSGYAAAHNMETNVEDNKNIKSPEATPGVVPQTTPEDPPTIVVADSAPADPNSVDTSASAQEADGNVSKFSGDRRPSKSRKSVRFIAEDDSHERHPSFEDRVKHEHGFEKKVVNHEVDSLNDNEDLASPTNEGPLTEGPILVVTPPTQPSYEASQLSEENAKLSEQIRLLNELLAQYEASYAKGDESIRQAKETMAAQAAELTRLKEVVEVKEDLLRQTELEFLDERKGLQAEIAKHQEAAAMWEQKLKSEQEAWQNLLSAGKQKLALLSTQREEALAQVQELQQQLAAVQEQLNATPSGESSELVADLTQQRDTAVAERDQAVQSKQSLLAYGKAQLEAKDAEIAELQEQVSAASTQQTTASEQLKDLQDQLQSENSRAEDLQKQLAVASEAHARELADRDETIALKERELASLRQQLSERLIEQDKQLQAARAPSDSMDQDDEKEAPPVPLRVKITSPEETARELAPPPAAVLDADQEAKLAEKERQIVELTDKIRTLEMQLAAKNDEERKFSDLELKVKALEEERSALTKTIEDLELERDTIRATQQSAAENERRAFQLQTSAVREKETVESRAHRLAADLEQRTAELLEASRKLQAVERLLETNKELLTEEALARRRVTTQYEEAKLVITRMADTSTKEKLAIRTAWSKRLKTVERHLSLKQDEVKRLKGDLERTVGGHSMRWVVIMGFLLFLYSLRHWDPSTPPY